MIVLPYQNVRIKLFKASALDNPNGLERQVNDFCKDRDVLNVDLRVDPTKSTHSNLYAMVTYLASPLDKETQDSDCKNRQVLADLFNGFDTQKYWDEYNKEHPGENKEEIKGTVGREKL